MFSSSIDHNPLAQDELGIQQALSVCSQMEYNSCTCVSRMYKDHGQTS